MSNLIVFYNNVQTHLLLLLHYPNTIILIMSKNRGGLGQKRRETTCAPEIKCPRLSPCLNSHKRRENFKNIDN